MYNFVWVALGILASSMSIISFIQKLFSIGLAPLALMIINFYRKMFYPFFDLLSYVLNFHVPEWYRDAFVLSAFFSFGFFNTQLNIYSAIHNIEVRIAKKIKHGYFIGAALQAITLLGLLRPFEVIIAYVNLREHISVAKRETIEDDMLYLESHPELKENFGAFRACADPFMHRYQSHIVWGSSDAERQLLEFVHDINWQYHWSFIEYIDRYELCVSYFLRLLLIAVICVIFYAFNSTLWT